MKNNYVIIITILLIVIFPLNVNAAGNVEISRANKTLIIYSNNSNLGNISRTIRTYSIENGVSYHISSNMLSPGDDKAPKSYLISPTSSPDLKQIGIIQYGKSKGYSDIAIQIALYFEAVWTDKADDDFFAFPLSLYLDGKDPIGNGINQINDSSGEVKKAFEIFFDSSEITTKKNQTGYSSAVYNFECESGTCYYPSKNNSVTVSSLKKLDIPDDAIIKSISVDDGTTVTGNYVNLKASEATISFFKNANRTICENCASAKISIDYDHPSNVSIPELALPNGGEGVNVINSSNMLTYKNATISTKTFTIFSGETSTLANETFHRLYSCDINLVVEGGVSNPSDADFKAETLQENLDDEKLVVDYSKIYGKRACNNSEYLVYSDEAAAGNNFSTNRYCRIYCKEDVQIDIPNKVIPPSNSNGIVFSGRYFTLQDLLIESKKTCTTTKTDVLGNPTNEPGINLELFYRDVYGYLWSETTVTRPTADQLNQIRNTGGGGSGGGGGGGTPSGSNSQYASNKCAAAIIESLASQAEDTSEKFIDEYNNTICKEWIEDRRTGCEDGCKGPGCCFDYTVMVCASDETLTYIVEGHVSKGNTTLGTIRSAVSDYNLSATGTASCFEQVMNALNLTGVDVQKEGWQNNSNDYEISFSINVVDNEKGNCSYQTFMSHAGDTYNPVGSSEKPLTQQTTYNANDEINGIDRKLDLNRDSIYQKYLLFNDSPLSAEQSQAREDYRKSVYDKAYANEFNNLVKAGFSREQAQYRASSAANDIANAEVIALDDIITSAEKSLQSSDYNRLQEYVFDGKKLPNSLHGSAAGAEKRASINFKSTEGSIEDLIECSTFYKYIDYKYEPEISFKYCDEYDIDYEMNGEVSPMITVEYCFSQPDIIDYECPEKDKIVFELNKKEEIDGKSGFEIIEYLRKAQSTSGISFEKFITNLKYFNCEGQCSSDEVERALISTALGAKVEYTAKWTANSVTKYYSVLPTGVARTIPITGRSILLGTDGVVFPVNITNKKKTCEYSFEIRHLGEREFEKCFPEMQNAYTCFFDIENEILKPCETCDSNGIQYFYRPISLSNVFPNSEGKASLNQYRTIGHNWNNEKGEETKKEIEAENDTIYANNGDGGNGPEYSYTITPIQAYHIRAYNEETENLNLGYADFNMTCDEYGKQCRSKWLDGQIGSCGGNANCGQYYFTDNMTVMPDDLSTRTVYFCTWQDGTSWKGATQYEICPYSDATQEYLEASID